MLASELFIIAFFAVSGVWCRYASVAEAVVSGAFELGGAYPWLSLCPLGVCCLLFALSSLIRNERWGRSGARSNLWQETETVSSGALPTSWMAGQRTTLLFDQR